VTVRTGERRRTARERGREAEDLAAAWLESHGFQVLARNHATRHGEVDLICREGATLCFVEVRSRHAGSTTSPAESVTRAKMRRVVAAATDWARRHESLEQPTRFDLVSVVTHPDAPTIELLRGAFDATGEAPY
jgi:putative endonuclease